jgi:hypothetical protein
VSDTSPEVLALGDAVKALMRVRAADLPDDTVLADTEVLLSLRDRIDAALADHLGAADTRDVPVAVYGRQVRGWLVEELYVDRTATSRLLRAARQVPHWPATEAAWRDGLISLDHVLVILGALKSVPAEVVDVVEKALIEFAQQAAPHLLAQAVDEVLLACGVESSADEAAARRYGTRGLSVAKTFGGTGSLSATLTAVLTDKFERALDHAIDAPSTDDDRTLAQLRHDALEKIVDHFLASSDDVPDHVNGEPPARVIVTIPLEVLEGRLESAWASLPGGVKIAPATARRLACDAAVIPVVLGSKSQVLDMGRAVRTFSVATRRAAWIRDGGRCTFPGCQNRPVECHHIVEWARGGPSDLDNAAWLCTFHHWLVHEAGWSLRRERDGTYTWTGPAGQRRSSSPASRGLRLTTCAPPRAAGPAVRRN